MTTDDWPQRRTALRALLEDGQWESAPTWAGAEEYTIKAANGDGYRRTVAKFRHHEDAHAIVALRAALPRLLADSERAEQLEAALRAALGPGGVGDLCDCSACGKVKAQYRQAHGDYVCERCGYRGEIGAIACQCYDYPCRGLGEQSRGTGCPHGFGMCPVCANGERDAWEIIRAVRAALEGGDGDGK